MSKFFRHFRRKQSNENATPNKGKSYKPKPKGGSANNSIDPSASVVNTALTAKPGAKNSALTRRQRYKLVKRYLKNKKSDARVAEEQKTARATTWAASLANSTQNITGGLRSSYPSRTEVVNNPVNKGGSSDEDEESSGDFGGLI